MPITTAIVAQAHVDAWKKQIDATPGTGDTFKLGLFANAVTGTYDALNGTQYSDITGNSDEHANAGGYSPGGLNSAVAAGLPDLGGAIMHINWTSVTWSSSTINSIGAFLYDDTHTNKRVIVFDATDSAVGGHHALA